nr:hypothetical protein [Tanacetum cinerariifolium]
MVLTTSVMTKLVIFTHNSILVVRIAGDLRKPFSVNQRMKIIAMSKFLAVILILLVLTIRIEEEQAAKARYWKIIACCDDDDDYDSAITPDLSTEETDNSLKFENFYFDLGEISSGSTTIHYDISLPDYEAFYFDDDITPEISSGSTTTHSDISLSEYDSFIFDLTHEEFVDELAHIISPPEYDRFYFWNFPDPGGGHCYICGHNQNSLNDSPSISETSSQSPLNIDHYCYECGDPLDAIFCKQCTCKSCGKGTHVGYNCPPKVPIIPNPEP